MLRRRRISVILLAAVLEREGRGGRFSIRYWPIRTMAGLLVGFAICMNVSNARAECYSVTGLTCDRSPFDVQSEFVAHGRGLPSASTEIESADKRVSLSLREIQGADLFSKDRVLVTDDLRSGGNWRRQMSLDLGVLRSEVIDVDLNAGFSDLRLPSTRGQSMKIGALSGWERNRVSDTSLNVSFFDGRFGYQSSYFLSEYAMDFDADPISDRENSDATGAAQWHKMEAQLIRGEDKSASVYGLYRDVNDEFRSLRDKSVSVYSVDGRKRRIGGRSILGSDRNSAREIAKSFKTGTYWSPGTTKATGEFGEVGGHVKLGRFEVAGRIDSGSEQTADQFGYSVPQTAKAKLRFRQKPVGLAAWTQKKSAQDEIEETLGASANLYVDQALGLADIELSGGLALLLPDTLSAHLSQKTTVAGVSGVLGRTGTQVGFGVDWEWDSGVTNASLSQFISESSNRFPAVADSTDYSLDLTHTMFGESWDVTGYLSANQSVSGQHAAASSSLYLGGGASFWLGLNSFPDFVVGVDFNEFSARDSLSSSLYTDYYLTLSLDFAKYVRMDKKDRRTFLKLSHRIQGIANSEGEAAREDDIAHAFVFSYGMGF
jgi:hypothetical protein